jgi:hypothetical protein
LNKLLRDNNGQLRNGWWILVFSVVFLASQFAYHPVSKALQNFGAGKEWLAPLPVVFLLLVTWVCMRLRRQPLSGVGLRLNATWLRQVLGGIAFGSVLMLAVTALIFLIGGVRFELDPARGVAALATGVWFFVWVAVLEELLFRGFVFQRLVDGIGAPLALLSMAVLFAIAHWGNPGMQGTTLVWATIDTALGGILLGLAYLRTGSLALPIGIHFVMALERYGAWRRHRAVAGVASGLRQLTPADPSPPCTSGRVGKVCAEPERRDPQLQEAGSVRSRSSARS